MAYSDGVHILCLTNVYWLHMKNSFNSFWMLPTLLSHVWLKMASAPLLPVARPHPLLFAVILSSNFFIVKLWSRSRTEHWAVLLYGLDSVWLVEVTEVIFCCSQVWCCYFCQFVASAICNCPAPSPTAVGLFNCVCSTEFVCTSCVQVRKSSIWHVLLAASTGVRSSAPLLVWSGYPECSTP